MPKLGIYLDEADRLVREGAFDEAATYLSQHLEENEYSQDAKSAVSWRLRDISERLMEKREFPRSFKFYDSYLNSAKPLLSSDEYRDAIIFAITKCKWIIEVQTSSNSFDIAKKYFDRILSYGRQLNDSEAYDGILSYIVGKYTEEMKKKVSDGGLINRLKNESDKYIGMITDSNVRDDLRNKRVLPDDRTKTY